MSVKWIQAYPSNKKVHFLTPIPDEIDIDDIAHHLSNICRFNGGISKTYSVAEHSLHVSRLVSPHLALAGLLHDASEAYIGDVVKQQKEHFGNYKYIENNLMEVIAAKFNLKCNFWKHSEIKKVDERLAFTEAKKLGKDISQWPTKQIPYSDDVIQCFTPRIARSEFLSRFWSIYDDSEDITGYRK